MTVTLFKEWRAAAAAAVDADAAWATDNRHWGSYCYFSIRWQNGQRKGVQLILENQKHYDVEVAVDVCV